MNPTVPAGLSFRSAELWKSAVKAGSRSPGRLVLLEEGLRCLDAAARCREMLAGQELVISGGHGGHGQRLNPLVGAGANALESFVRIWRLLKLEYDPAVDGTEFTSVYELPPAERYRSARRTAPRNTHEVEEVHEP